jgi:hypothetical protein
VRAYETDDDEPEDGWPVGFPETGAVDVTLAKRRMRSSSRVMTVL